jgi:hypothetical protein
MSDSSRKDRLFAVAILVLGIVGFAALSWAMPSRNSDVKDETKVSQKVPGAIKIAPKLAALYGIKSEAAVGRTWQPRMAVFGRVIPNPFATAELRAPFAGTVHATAKGWPEIGGRIAVGQDLAIVQARFSPQERLDVLSKAAEAQEKLKGAEEVVRVQHDRVQRLSSVVGIVPGPELDQAKVALAEAKALVAGAQAQAKLWQNVADNLDHQPIAVTLNAPIDGEIVELAVRPKTAVEGGAAILKIVDFRYGLIRVDVPLGLGTPAAELDFAAVGPNLDQRTKIKGRRSGTASVDAASQMAGYFYQLELPKDDATWRPGLFVSADLPDPARQPINAVVVPAAAVLYHQGRALVYVELNPGRFERREVHVLGRVGDFISLGRGVRAGEAIVSGHPQAILSEEFRGEADDD